MDSGCSPSLTDGSGHVKWWKCPTGVLSFQDSLDPQKVLAHHCDMERLMRESVEQTNRNLAEIGPGFRGQQTPDTYPIDPRCVIK